MSLMKSNRCMVSRITSTLVLASLCTVSAPGAGYIKFDDINGESQAAGRIDESDVLSWSWSVVREESGETGSTRTRGTPKVEDLVVTKVLDSASVKLLEACIQGKVHPKVTLELERPGAGGAAFTYLAIEMTSVVISSYSVGGAQGEDRPTESVSMNFDEVKVTYSLQNPDGSPGGKVETTWNIEEGTP